MQENPGLLMNMDNAKNELRKVRGHIVLQPLSFLEETLGVTTKYKPPYLTQIPKGGDDPDDLLLLC